MAKWKPGKPGRPPKGVKYTSKTKKAKKSKSRRGPGRPKGSTNSKFTKGKTYTARVTIL